MRDFTPELERRSSPRRRPNVACELFIGAERHEAVLVDCSRDGIFVETDAPVWPAAMVRVRLQGAERFALVVRQRHVPHGLRELAPGGIGLRWVRGETAH